jgi:hypothetical protein
MPISRVGRSSFWGHVKLLSERKLDPVQLNSLSFFTGRRPITLMELRSRACYAGNCKELYCLVRDSTPGNETIKYWTPLETSIA